MMVIDLSMPCFRYLRRTRLSLALGLGGAVFFLTAVDAEAQCSGCFQSYPGTFECGEMVEDPDCEGGTGMECYECRWEYAAVPSDLSPFGTLHSNALISTSEVEINLPKLEEHSRGYYVGRSMCSGAIVLRQYNKDSAQSARLRTETLVFQ